MCGIAGLLRLKGEALPDSRRLLRIRDHMASRGPDDAGTWYDPSDRVALAHRRLAVIDPRATGHQPMVSRFGEHIITFNGEIYNFPALRRKLEDAGYGFHTESDTEVLLALYHFHGDAMFGHLRGMYAMAIWDATQERLLLARDPYGIKPLYYTRRGNGFAFASQVRALLAGGQISREVDPAGEAGFLLTGSVPEPWTWYRDIACLPAGSCLWVDQNGPGKAFQHTDVARLIARPGEPTWQPEEVTKRVRESLLDSVQHHLVADIPVGLFLSAGIDSGALAGLAMELRDQPLQTMTLGFKEYAGSSQDEMPIARTVSRHFGTHHHERLVTRSEFEDDLPAIIEAMDQPSIDGINTWFISKAAAEQGLRVMLSGVGGDEMFGGYPSFQDIPRWHRRWGWISAIPGLPALAWSARGLGIAGRLSTKAWALPRYAGTPGGAYLLRRGLFMPEEITQLMDPERAADGLRALNPPGCFEMEAQTDDCRISAMESRFYLRNQLLRDIDWSAMAHSVEVRTPLVDLELTRSLASNLVGRRRKDFLAHTPYTALPNLVTERTRTGFTTPIGDWMMRSKMLSVLPHDRMSGSGKSHWSRRYAIALHGLYASQ